MKRNTIKIIERSDFVNMGPIRLRQPLPTQKVDMIDPFLLLHHYGPYHISEEHNPFDLGPHPHRGFEPITFLFQGEQLHRDSLGNESIVKPGDVQWTTAGRGIVHAEAPTKAFIKKGGYIEGIQLWLNLPSKKKMISANYQHVKSEDFNMVKSTDGKAIIKVIAGSLNDEIGKIGTQTDVNVYTLDMESGANFSFPIPNSHQSMLYLLRGSVYVNESDLLKLDENQLMQFNQDGEGISIKAYEKSTLIFLSGEPFNEPVSTYGPYVMNTQTEILEAMRDYQMGKMGFLPVS